MFKIPNKIKIGDVCYTIRKEKKPFKTSIKEDKDDTIGEIRYTNRVIRVMTNDKRCKHILLHEVLHAILYFMVEDSKQNEKFIDVILGGLRMVIVDNPWLLEAFKE